AYKTSVVLADVVQCRESGLELVAQRPGHGAGAVRLAAEAAEADAAVRAAAERHIIELGIKAAELAAIHGGDLPGVVCP
ncbi:MAG TPA: hypothetical protein VHU77_02910, partial [Candidatus Limnocylindria bacterium]|nr:hypothetical protein [Candidatus Limnocylindria bacterium]